MFTSTEQVSTLSQTRTYNALLPVQRFFSPFWTRRGKFQRTTERCHHTEYERVCPVKFWYYNNLITNQQNTLIIDKQKHRQMKSENLSKQCAKSRTLNNEWTILYHVKLKLFTTVIAIENIQVNKTAVLTDQINFYKY
jgi:hypothetical protein